MIDHESLKPNYGPEAALTLGSITSVSLALASDFSEASIATSPSGSSLKLLESLEPLGGGTTTVISSSASFTGVVLVCSTPSSTISTSSVPFTPFSTGSAPFGRDLLVPPSFAVVLLLPFFDDEVLAFVEVVRVGTGLSLELELCELDLAFSPLVDEEVSLLDRRFRRSLGMSKVMQEPQAS